MAADFGYTALRPAARRPEGTVPRSAPGLDFPRHPPIPIDDGVPRMVSPVAHQPAPADHDVPHWGRIPREDPGVQQRVLRTARELWVVRVENEEIGALPDGDATRTATERAVPPGDGTLEQSAPCRAICATSGDVALPEAEALPVLEPPELLGADQLIDAIRRQGLAFDVQDGGSRVVFRTGDGTPFLAVTLETVPVVIPKSEEIH